MIGDLDPYICGLSRDWWTVLNTIGTVFAALGTVGAVIVSLYLIRRSSVFRGNLTVNIAAIVDTTAEVNFRFLAIKLVNTSERNVKVTGIGWRVKPWPDESLLHQLFHPVPFLPQAPLPAILLPGDDLTWYIDIHDGEWFTDVCRDWKKRPRKIYVYAALSDGTMFVKKVGTGILASFQDSFDKAHGVRRLFANMMRSR